MILMWTKSKLTKYFEGMLQPVEDCLLESPLFQKKVKENIGIGNFTMVLLLVHLVRRNGAKQNLRIFFPLVSPSKKKRRNFNIHLDVLLKLICMKNMTNCITGIIRFLFFFIFTWFDFNLTMFLDSCVLPIHVNQTPRLTEILCLQMLYFARAFLSYCCVFPIHAFIESCNSEELLQIYFIFR